MRLNELKSYYRIEDAYILFYVGVGSKSCRDLLTCAIKQSQDYCNHNHTVKIGFIPQVVIAIYATTILESFRNMSFVFYNQF